MHYVTCTSLFVTRPGLAYFYFNNKKKNYFIFGNCSLRFLTKRYINKFQVEGSASALIPNFSHSLKVMCLFAGYLKGNLIM